MESISLHYIIFKTEKNRATNFNQLNFSLHSTFFLCYLSKVFEL